ncbi:hypothetical protein VTN77DRAFT_7542 [Rasamsonia byssochlamydoides]|uniref:uncharacterized protein n=1 Tax=Rasamsonia byssochlamydoides TaxID=89139 RepID=UPI0037432175
MAPSSLLRATLPLRSSLLSFLCSSATSATVTSSRSAAYSSSRILSDSSRRAAYSTSTTTTSDEQPQQQEQQQPQQQQQQQEGQSPSASESSTPPTTTSSSSPSLPTPSLRQYPYTVKVGTVTSVGLMDKTVRVAHRHMTWDRHIRKYYPKVTTYLVSDPRNSLREGDVIEFSSGAPKSRHVRHVVERIISPFGVPIEERPPVMTREEREAEWAAKRAAKLQRRYQRWVESGKQGPPPVGDHVGRIKSLVMARVAEEKEKQKLKEQQQQQKQAEAQA